MSSSHPAKRPPGRPVDTTLGPSIVMAARDILAESGYGGLTTAGVAKRAGVSTATLYRRWPTKKDLIIAAARQLVVLHADAATHTDAKAGGGATGADEAGTGDGAVESRAGEAVGTTAEGAGPATPLPDTGSLRGDLAALLEEKNRMLTGATGCALLAILGEARLDPELDELLRSELHEATREHLEQIRARARARGEDVTDLDPEAAARLVLGALIAGIALGGPEPTSVRAPLTRADIELLLRALGD